MIGGKRDFNVLFLLKFSRGTSDPPSKDYPKEPGPGTTQSQTLQETLSLADSMGPIQSAAPKKGRFSPRRRRPSTTGTGEATSIGRCLGKLTYQRTAAHVGSTATTSPRSRSMETLPGRPLASGRRPRFHHAPTIGGSPSHLPNRSDGCPPACPHLKSQPPRRRRSPVRQPPPRRFSSGVEPFADPKDPPIHSRTVD